MNDGASPEEVARRYAVVTKDWQHPPGRPLTRRFLPLDEQLYIYLLALDYLHFAQADRKLHEHLQRHYSQVVCMTDEIRALGTVSFDDLSKPSRMHSMRALLVKAVGEEISEKVFRGVLLDARKLMERYLLLLMPPLPPAVDATLAAAALIFAWGVRRHPQTYKPYIHGQLNQSGSVKAAMRMNVSDGFEEFERIWCYGIDWLKFALCGQLAAYEAWMNLRITLIRLVEQFIQTHDTELVSNLLYNLREYAEGGIYSVPQRAHNSQ